MFIGEHAPRETKDGEDVQHVSPLESRTRSRVLHMVSADGPITAAELGRHLDLTPAAVRRHLDALVEQGAVVPHEPTGGRRGRGRPARAYVVSDAGHSALEADYDSLAVEVLRYLEAHAGSGCRRRLRPQPRRRPSRSGMPPASPPPATPPPLAPRRSSRR